MLRKRWQQWVTEREVMGCEMVGVSGDSWETAQSSFSQNMKWAQHNILKSDKIPFLFISIMAIDSLSLSDHRSRSKGSHERHTNTLIVSWNTQAHTKFPVGIYFKISYLRSPPAAASLILQLLIKISLSNTDIKKKVRATKIKRRKLGWKTCEMESYREEQGHEPTADKRHRKMNRRRFSLLSNVLLGEITTVKTDTHQ